MDLIWIILLVVLAVVVLFLIVTYNALVRLRNMVDEAWNQISVQLKRRHDLIPNLVNAVKGYMDFEQETLTRVIEARSAAVTAQQGGPANAGQAAQADSPEACHGLACAEEWAGDFEAAVRLYERAFAGYRARGETRLPAVMSLPTVH